MSISCGSFSGVLLVCRSFKSLVCCCNQPPMLQCHLMNWTGFSQFLPLFLVILCFHFFCGPIWTQVPEQCEGLKSRFLKFSYLWSWMLKSWANKNTVHPRKLTCNLKITPWKRRNIYKPPIFGFHVGFRGGVVLCSSTRCIPLTVLQFSCQDLVSSQTLVMSVPFLWCGPAAGSCTISIGLLVSIPYQS